MALRWLLGQATQGSADAFVEAEIATGLSNVTRSAFRIRRIEWYTPGVIGADSSVTMTLRRTSAASVSFLAANAMIGGRWVSTELTTSGMFTYEPFITIPYAKDEELLIVEETLFLQLDSTGTGNANTGAVRIGYEVRSITETERLSILSLTASA